MYDAASALHKSIRGSDPDAALHCLARFLEAGDLSSPRRRLLCAASEDVGLAYPQAITIVKSCVDTAMQLGLPEAQLPLAQAAILLATAPKSNSVCTGIMSAWADVKAGRGGDVPRELQNVHADSAGLEREQGYKYPHNYGHHWVRQQYLPDAIKNAHYYHYGDNKTEQAAKSYWEKIRNLSEFRDHRRPLTVGGGVDPAIQYPVGDPVGQRFRRLRRRQHFNDLQFDLHALRADGADGDGDPVPLPQILPLVGEAGEVEASSTKQP